MSSEIETASDTEAADEGRIELVGWEPEKTGYLDSNLLTAAAYEDMENLARLVEEEGCSVTEPHGAGGYYALHWAAFRNSTVAAQYIIDHGGDVNATDNTGHTALHWSAFTGHTAVAEVLLKAGAHVGAADLNGLQTAHFAAQYGHTFFLVQIVAKGNAAPDVPDNDGRSPLHWAAYKGFADCIRLLLFLDADSGRQDNEGYTSLHLAAIRGNHDACTALVQEGKKEELMTKIRGFTPAQLASNHNHRQVAIFLGNAEKLFERRCDGNSYLGRLYKFERVPAVWCLSGFLLYTYFNFVIAAPFMPMKAEDWIFACSGISLAVIGLILFFWCWRKDPGFIKRNIRDTHNVIDYQSLLNMELNLPFFRAGNTSQLCARCKVTRPLFAKHCLTCDRCVEQFVPHCPWVSNCIGKRTKWQFVMFQVLVVAAMVITGASTYIRIQSDTRTVEAGGAPYKNPTLQALQTFFEKGAFFHPGAMVFFVADQLVLLGVIARIV